MWLPWAAFPRTRRKLPRSGLGTNAEPFRVLPHRRPAVLTVNGKMSRHRDNHEQCRFKLNDLSENCDTRTWTTWYDRSNTVDIATIASLVGLVLTVAGFLGVSPDKHPRIRSLTSTASLPGWLLMFCPELGKWALRGSGQDFQVHATRHKCTDPKSSISLPRIPAHFWMVIVGAVWLCAALLFPPRSRRCSPQLLTASQTIPPSQSQPAKAITPTKEEPVNPLTARSPYGPPCTIATRSIVGYPKHPNNTATALRNTRLGLRH